MNCKPGDLAIVVKCFHTEAIGKIVEVMGWTSIKAEIGVCSGWSVRFIDRKFPGVFDLERSPAPDECLRPITGLPIDEETREELTA